MLSTGGWSDDAELNWPGTKLTKLKGMTHSHVSCWTGGNLTLSSSLTQSQSVMVALPQIQLSFGASTRAWDDRELIAACDAAMEEFHVSER